MSCYKKDKIDQKDVIDFEDLILEIQATKNTGPKEVDYSIIVRENIDVETKGELISADDLIENLQEVGVNNFREVTCFVSRLRTRRSARAQRSYIWIFNGTLNNFDLRFSIANWSSGSSGREYIRQDHRINKIE